jgi:cell division protein FtsB
MLDDLKNIKNLKDHPWLTQLRDVRAVGLLIFLVVVLMMSWSGAKVIQRNYELQKQISQLRQENSVQGLANNNVRLENDYFKTNQYLELKARQDFGLGQPGETELIVPKDVALKYTTPLPNRSVSAASEAASHRSAYQQNFEQWVDFFMHRQGEL